MFKPSDLAAIANGACATTCSTHHPQPNPSTEDMLANIRDALQKLRDNDPLALFFERKGISVATHNVFMHESHRSSFANPPDFIKFSPDVPIDQIMAVNRNLHDLHYKEQKESSFTDMWMNKAGL